MNEKILENWKKAQEAGAWLPCPRCGRLTMRESLYENALSRRTDIYICGACGNEEALEDVPFGMSATKEFDKLPVEAWFVCRTVFGQTNPVKKKGGYEICTGQTVFLKEEDIDDIMVCALEGGINYWCCKAEVPEDEYKGEWAHEQIARGGALMLFDAEEDAVYELTLEKFLNGFKLWVENGYDRYGAVFGGKVDCCEIDADCADSIVQLALFGEVVYG